MTRSEVLKDNRNWVKAQAQSRAASALKKIQRKAAYNMNPNLCEFCGGIIPYEKICKSGRSTRFCSKAHSAQFNNKRRAHSEETKRKIGRANKEIFSTSEARERCRVNSSGRKHTPATIEKMKLRAQSLNCNKVCSKETKQKLQKHSLKRSDGLRKLGLASYDRYEPKLRLYEEDLRRSPDDERVLQVLCYKCKQWMMPTPDQVGDRIFAINHYGSGECHFYCGSECKNSCSIYKKPPIAPTDFGSSEGEAPLEVSQIVRRRAKGICERCREKPGVHCHHTEPRKCSPMLEADVDLCLWVCLDCHIECHRKDGCGFGYLAYIEFDKTPILES